MGKEKVDQAGVPDGWTKKWNEKKAKFYYVNDATKKSQWAEPEGKCTSYSI